MGCPRYEDRHYPPSKERSASTIEAAIRKAAKKPTGELTKADYEKIKSLKITVNIDSIWVTDSPLIHATGLEKLTQLKILDLSSNQLNDLKGLENLTQLKILDLSNNQLNDLKGLENLAQVKTLNLCFNQLVDVKGLENLMQLKTLSLWNNQLTNVKELEELTRLEFLDLKDNPDLTKAQIDELQKALPNCEISSNPKEVTALIAPRESP